MKSFRKRADSVSHEGMRQMAGGTFTMGSDRFYQEERPARRVKVDPFWIDETPVTNAMFTDFVAATGYETYVEQPADPKQYPGLDPALVVPGSLVFTPPDRVVSLNDFTQWWAFVPGANWRHPTGPDSSIGGLKDHPVVHMAYEDARAYARWSGKSLPTEAEWEFAARGGLVDADYAWGDALVPDGAVLANYWQGDFPSGSTKPDGAFRTSAVGSFPANGHGLFDMIGNVWEWTRDWYGMARPAVTKGSCCEAVNPRGPAIGESYDPAETGSRIGRKVLKGGSHLCAESYCQRYRPAARHAQHVDSATSHIGFRCVSRRGLGRG